MLENSKGFSKGLSQNELMKIITSSVYISITNRCNAACRHCIVMNDDIDLIDADYEDVINWIEQLNDSGIKAVHLVGGEPFIVRKELNSYVRKLGELGMYAGVVTNGLWAKTVEEGIAVLEEMPDLMGLIISSDKYHLEYIDAQIVKNAIEAGLATGKFVNVNVTYVESEEVKVINELYKEYRNRILIHPVKAMPFDGEDSKKIKRSKLFKNPRRIANYCGIGNYFIDVDGKMDGCCQAARSKETQYLHLGNINEERLSDMLKKFKEKEVYKYIHKYGPKGIAQLFLESPYAKELKEREFTSDCEICCELLDNPSMYDYFITQVMKRVD